MSAYENLPVYKKALDLAGYFDEIVSHFAKRHKYTIGAKLFNLSCDILVLIAAANTRVDRKDCLIRSLSKLESIKVLLHLCKEKKMFHSFNSFEVSVKLVVNVSKQCEGWLKDLSSPSGKSCGKRAIL